MKSVKQTKGAKIIPMFPTTQVKKAWKVITTLANGERIIKTIPMNVEPYYKPIA